MSILSETEKRKIFIRRRGKCAGCGKKIRGLPDAEFHHKNRNRNDNRPENISLLHQRCHIELHKHRP